MAELKRVGVWMLVLALAFMRSAQGADLFDIRAATPPREVNAEYFGTHFHRLWGPDTTERRGTPWPEGQIGTIRLWGSYTRWAEIEPRPGRFDFERLDFYVATAERHHASVLLVLGSAAPWASARPREPGPFGPGSAAEPADIGAWDRYVTAVVQRYKGRISHYELWNEPYFSEMPGAQSEAPGTLFFTGSVKKMVELAEHTRAILDREDPDAVLLTPGVDRFPAVLDMFLNAGGGRYVGGVAFHYYVHVDTDREFLQMHQRVKAVLARHQLGALPIFNTESGFESKGSNGRVGAELLARQMILGAFVGLDRFYQYAWDNGDSGMSGTAGGPTESRSGEAYAAVRRWLLGARLEGCRHAPSDVMICQATREDAKLLIVWRPSSEGLVMWRLPEGAQVETLERAVADARLNMLDHDRQVAVNGDPVAIMLKPARP